MIVRKNTQTRTLFGLGIRGRRGNGRWHGGLLRGGGRAVGGFGSAASGKGQKDGGDEAGKDDYLHDVNGRLV